MKWGACTHVVQDNSTIRGARRQNRCFDLVEADMVDCVDSRGPHEVLHWRTRSTSGVVYGDDVGCGSEGGQRSMVGDGCEGGVSVPCSFGRRLGNLSVRLEHLDLLVCTTGDQTLVARPAHALDHVLVRLRLPLLFPAREVPYFDDTVTTAAGKVLERVGVLGERIDTVYMARLKISKEGLRKHALDLGRIESSRVLACAFEGVLVGVEVAGYLGDIGSGGLRRRRRAAEGFDLHLRCLAADLLRRRGEHQ